MRGIIPKLSTRLTTLAARFIDHGDYVALSASHPVIKAARSLERGDKSGRLVDFNFAMDAWRERFLDHGDEVSAEEAVRLAGLAYLWQERQWSVRGGPN